MRKIIWLLFLFSPITFFGQKIIIESDFIVRDILVDCNRVKLTWKWADKKAAKLRNEEIKRRRKAPDSFRWFDL